MIRFENITLKVHERTLLDSVDLAVSEGDKLVIRGESGSGKSSLMRCAVGGLPMSGGSVRLDGIELSAATVSEVRSRIGFIGQEPVLGAPRVREALLLPFSFKTHKEQTPTEDHIFQTLEKLRLTRDILEKPVNRISGGEKQRIAIARALLLNKRIFLADEITSALDPESKAAVMEQLFKPDITLLSVSHDPDWIGACNRVIEIRQGNLQEEIGRTSTHNRIHETPSRDSMSSFAADESIGGQS